MKSELYGLPDLNGVLPGQPGSIVKGTRREGWLLAEQQPRLPVPEATKPKWMQRLESQQKANHDVENNVVNLLRRQAD